MRVQHIVVGAERTNCFLLEDAGDTVIIDPGDEAGAIMRLLGDRVPSKIVLTHRHWDHLCAADELREAYGSELWVSELDADGVQSSGVDGNMSQLEVEKGTISRACVLAAPDRRVRGGDIVPCGRDILRVIETPGHTKGSISLYSEKAAALFTGDTLFAHGLFGNTDAPTGSSRDMVRTWASKFRGIPDSVRLYPGHGDFSTLGAERVLNPNIR